MLNIKVVLENDFDARIRPEIIPIFDEITARRP